MKKLALLMTVISLGISQDHSDTEKILEMLRKKEQEQQQKDLETKRKQEELRKKVFQECEDFPAEKLGKPENYIVFKPDFLGIALQNIEAKVKRLEGPIAEKRYTENVGGNPTTEIQYLAYHIEVPMTLKEFVDKSFLVPKIRARELDNLEKAMFAVKWFSVKQETKAGTGIDTTRKPSTYTRNFDGTLRNTYGTVEQKEILITESPHLLMSSQKYGTSAPLISPIMLYAYYSDDKNYCILWENVSSRNFNVGAFLSGGFGAYTAENVRVFQDMKVNKSAMLEVDAGDLGKYRLYISALRNDKGRILPKEKDRGVSLSIDEGIGGRAYCFNKDDVRQFISTLKQSGREDFLRQAGIPSPDYISVCGFIPFDILERSTDPNMRSFVFSELRRAWYPNLACIEFQDHICTLGMSPVEVKFEFFRGATRGATREDIGKALEYLKVKHQARILGTPTPDPPNIIGVEKPPIFVEEKGIKKLLPFDLEVLIGSLEYLARKGKEK